MANNVEFQLSAGRCTVVRDGHLQPDPREGILSVYSTEEGERRLAWTDFATHIMEQDVAIKKGDMEVRKVLQITSDVVFCIKNGSTKEKFFFYRQDDATDKRSSKAVFQELNTILEASETPSDESTPVANSTSRQPTPAPTCDHLYRSTEQWVDDLLEFRRKYKAQQAAQFRSKYRALEGQLEQMSTEELHAYIQHTCGMPTEAGTQDMQRESHDPTASAIEQMDDYGSTEEITPDILNFFMKIERKTLIRFWLHPDIWSEMEKLSGSDQLQKYSEDDMYDLNSDELEKVVRLFLAVVASKRIGQAVRSLRLGQNISQAADRGDVPGFVDAVKEAIKQYQHL